MKWINRILIVLTAMAIGSVVYGNYLSAEQKEEWRQCCEKQEPCK